MNISRKKFVIIFIISGFVFLFITSSLLGSTGPRGFPKPPDSILSRGRAQSLWKENGGPVVGLVVPIDPN